MSGVLLWVVCPKGSSSTFTSILTFVPRKPERRTVRALLSSPVVNLGRTLSSEERVYEVVLRQAALVRRETVADIGPRKNKFTEEEIDVNDDRVVGTAVPAGGGLLNEAYERCGDVCAEYAKTFYLGEFVCVFSCVVMVCFVFLLSDNVLITFFYKSKNAIRCDWCNNDCERNLTPIECRIAFDIIFCELNHLWNFQERC